MRKLFLEFQNVSFSYPSMSVELFQGVSFHLESGWTGIVGANGTGKTTMMQLAAGLLRPDGGVIVRPEHCVYCPQRTDHPPEALAAFLESGDKQAYRLRFELDIQIHWLENWSSLSHGERKRAQIATALWQSPDLLEIDEPTNHLDAAARELLMNSLRGFRGIGLLVSHDRELLNGLCDQLLFADPPGVQIRRGGLHAARTQAHREEVFALKTQERLKKEAGKLKRKAALHRDKASRSHELRSKKGIGRKDHDAKAKINLARVSGKDGSDGKLLRAVQGRLQQVQDKLEQVQIKKHYEIGISQPWQVSPRDLICTIESSELMIGRRRLRFPKLDIAPADRIALTGANGAGKSTLVRWILNQLLARKENFVYMPQEISMEDSRRLIDEVRGRSREDTGKIMTLVSRLGTRPGRLLESQMPSPGEIRKILLAKGIMESPDLIILDEPTNHLDLPSTLCLEEALTEFPGALLLVSHDRHFLNKLADLEWSIKAQDEDNLLILEADVFSRPENP